MASLKSATSRASLLVVVETEEGISCSRYSPTDVMLTMIVWHGGHYWRRLSTFNFLGYKLKQIYFFTDFRIDVTSHLKQEQKRIF